jgi:hypothetical protein
MQSSSNSRSNRYHSCRTASDMYYYK